MKRIENVLLGFNYSDLQYEWSQRMTFPKGWKKKLSRKAQREGGVECNSSAHSRPKHSQKGENHAALHGSERGEWQWVIYDTRGEPRGDSGVPLDDLLADWQVQSNSGR